jgi:hypothetical protein
MNIEDKMKIHIHKHPLSLRSFIKIFIIRLFCKHKDAKFLACTTAGFVDNNKIGVGVSFVCPRCHQSWIGGIKANITSTIDIKKHVDKPNYICNYAKKYNATLHD